MSARRNEASGNQASDLISARAEGADAVAARLRSIMSDPRCRGREGTAFSLAMKSPDMSPEAVCTVVAEFGAATPRSSMPSLADRMRQDDIGEALAPSSQVAPAEPDFVARMKGRHGVAEQTGPIR